MTATLNYSVWQIVTFFVDSSSPGRVCQYPVIGSLSATQLAPPGRLHSEEPAATAASSSCPPGCGGRGTRHRHLLRTQEGQPSSPRLRVTRQRTRAPCRLSYAPAAASCDLRSVKKIVRTGFFLWLRPLSNGLSLIPVSVQVSMGLLTYYSL